MKSAAKNLRAPHLATRVVVAEHGVELAKELYNEFERMNGEYFGSRLAQALILITPAQSARTLADYIGRDEHGLESRIRISKKTASLGLQFAADALMHELVHAWMHEVENDGENGYRGHGPKFAAKCNEIGAKLGLPEVGVKGRDGKPDCKAWPMCVRPEGFYGDVKFAPSTRKTRSKADDAAEGETDPDLAEAR
jgi:hypothetical protein